MNDIDAEFSGLLAWANCSKTSGGLPTLHIFAVDLTKARSAGMKSCESASAVIEIHDIGGSWR